MRSCKKQSERPKSLRVAVAWACALSLSVSVKFESLNLGEMLLCINIWVQYFNAAAVRAPLKHSEYLQGMSGTSWPYIYAQLQEAIRTAKVSLRVALGWPCAPSISFQICGNSLVEHAECLNLTFQCSARPFETFWMFTRNEWGPADHMRSCKKQSERPKSLRVVVGWPCMRPKRLL